MEEPRPTDTELRMQCIYAANQSNGELAKSVDQVIADAQKLFDFIKGNKSE